MKKIWLFDEIVLTVVFLLSSVTVLSAKTIDVELREIIQSVSEPPPHIDRKRNSFSFVSSKKRFFINDPDSQVEERVKLTIRYINGKNYKYEESITPLQPFTTLSTPDGQWYIGATRKWAVQDDHYITKGETPTELKEILSYFFDIVPHEKSVYKLVEETADTWVIDEFPQSDFVSRLSKNISSHGEKIGLVSEIMQDPRLALVRFSISKEWRMITSVEAYGESGFLWYQSAITNLEQVTPNPKLFKLPSDCTVLNGMDKIEEMLELDRKYREKNKHGK